MHRASVRYSPVFVYALCAHCTPVPCFRCILFNHSTIEFQPQLSYRFTSAVIHFFPFNNSFWICRFFSISSLCYPFVFSLLHTNTNRSKQLIISITRPFCVCVCDYNSTVMYVDAYGDQLLRRTSIWSMYIHCSRAHPNQMTLHETKLNFNSIEFWYAVFFRD